MSDELRPVRQLRRLERLLVGLGRCPSCRRWLGSASVEDVRGWHDTRTRSGGLAVGTSAMGVGRMMRGHITQLQHQKIPQCPRCKHTFLHGWIYPNKE